ncbi:alginate biosynthesis protein AlgJ [Marinobacter lipolyticus SM19]|uniref:Probable alginate O-acetylase AlgJ n=1 Tax=Marinobacter lipolyticus SM19 TaxID=1318628 RepID=R8AZG1_9GAMM|nr:alginate O-acetyltransferase [Marinobacter lipolyticus]EON91726.1 alginate biosynthesis protein AlgJ [Marinobacter lipolyticus SM19]
MTKTSARITAFLFIALVLVLGALSLRPLFGYKAKTGLSPVNGELARHLESHYDEQFPAKDLGTNLWAAINYTLFDEGRQGVVVGQDEWLFTDEEIYPASRDGEVVNRNLHRVQQIADHLLAEGIPLVVLVVPAKARIYSEKLGSTRPEPVMASLYEAFQQSLAQAGIPAPELKPALEQAQRHGEPVFLRTDTHWTPAGANLFAKGAAEYIRARFNGLSWGEKTFVTSLGQPVEHRGDLLNYIPVDPAFSEYGPAPDQLIPRTTRADGDDQADADALFGDDSTSTVLVGTSYSANELWDFPGALRKHLGRDLINVAEEGDGPIVPMVSYLNSSDFRDQPPQLVIWEFPERYLAQPLESGQALAWFRQADNMLTAQADSHSETNP